ncbi:MAG: helix-turn-helix domain-containing protein [Dehalococcoidia bacterium]
MATNIQDGAMLTIREVSQILHVHSNTLRRWSDQGIIRAYRIGPRGDRRFKREDIVSILQSKAEPIEPDAVNTSQA